MMQKHSAMTSLAKRHIAADAKAAFDSFHAKGGRPFHEFTPEQLRENYVTSTVVSGMPALEAIAHTDYDVGPFTIRVYVPRDSRLKRPQRGLCTCMVGAGSWVIWKHTTPCVSI